MTRSILVICCCLTLAGSLFAQTRNTLVSKNENSDVYRIRQGSDLTKVLPFSEQFQFDQFRDGVAYMRNGKISKTKFNYNLVHGEIMFVDPVRDTMLFSSPELVRQVVIGEHIYYFQKGQGHVEIMHDFGKVSLGRKPYLVRLGREKYASYDQYSSASAISSYSSYSSGSGQMQVLEGRDNIIIKRKAVLLLVDKNFRIYPANRASLTRIYSSDKSKINAFLKENAIDMEKEEDLLKTLEFCSSL